MISGLYDVNPAKFGQTDNITTFAKNFGRQVQMWNGVAFTVNARSAASADRLPSLAGLSARSGSEGATIRASHNRARHP